MRAISFAGLHRLLQAVADAPAGLRAREINGLVLEHGLTLTPRRLPPKPTTLYHYRNTLLRLTAFAREGLRLRANLHNPHVRELLRQPAPASDDQSLTDASRDHFAALVLNNHDCRTLFFDPFMPCATTCRSVSDFREHGCPVTWTRQPSTHAPTLVFRNSTTKRTTNHPARLGVPAVLYGLRYWARDQLALIDEYCDRPDEGATMFPVFRRAHPPVQPEPVVLQAVQFMLSLRAPHTADEWTVLSVSDLITRYCQAHHQPRTVLFDAIAWLHREWPRHTALIPTSLGLATLTAVSLGQQNLVLRRYFKPKRGPYISHIRLHRDVTADATTAQQHHA